MHGKHLLVIGASSYIGTCLIRYAQARNAQVTAISSSACNFLDPNAVGEFFQRLPRVRYSLIFLAVINKSTANTYQAFQDNISLIMNLVTYSTGASFDSLIYFSSVDVYGRPVQLPITEHTPAAPDTWYGLAKYNAEWILKNRWREPAPLTILRIPGIYGCAPRDRSVIGHFIRQTRQTGQVTVMGDGAVRRDYVYVLDVCRLVEALMRLQYHGTLNIATGRAYSIVDTIATIASVLRVAPTVVYRPTDEERHFDLLFDNTALRALLPTFTFTSLASGIASYLTGAVQV